MKMKVMIIATAVMLAITGVPAGAEVPFERAERAVGMFATGLAETAPRQARRGLQSSHLGDQHLSVGMETSVFGIDASAVEALADELAFAVPVGGDGQTHRLVEHFGMPLWTTTAELRAGFSLRSDLPRVDMGLRVAVPALEGMEMQRTHALLSSRHPSYGAMGDDEESEREELDEREGYRLIGVDARMPVVEVEGVVPGVIVGVGINRADVRLREADSFAEAITLTDVPGWEEDSGEEQEAVHSLVLEHPQLYLEWSSTSVEASATVANEVGPLRPFAGGTLAYSFTQVSTGIAAALTDGEGEEIDSEQREEIGGGEWLTPTDYGVGIELPAYHRVDPGVFAGSGVDVGFITVELAGSYELTSGRLGAHLAAGVRF